MKVFTIYGHGGDLGHVTWTICTKFSSPFPRRDVPVGVPLDLCTVMEWHELPKYNGIQVSQLIYPFPRRLRMKFGFDWPSGFRGEDL